MVEVITVFGMSDVRFIVKGFIFLTVSHSGLLGPFAKRMGSALVRSNRATVATLTYPNWLRKLLRKQLRFSHAGSIPVVSAYILVSCPNGKELV